MSLSFQTYRQIRYEQFVEDYYGEPFLILLLLSLPFQTYRQIRYEQFVEGYITDNGFFQSCTF